LGKQFVLDTNVLLHNPQSLATFGADNTVVIPIVTIEELDRFKTHLDAVGANARAAIRLMDQLSAEGDIVQGTPLPNGGTLRIELNHQETGLLPEGLDIEKADHRILAVAAALQQGDSESQVVLVSNDFNLRVKARSMGIRSEAYLNDQVGPVEHTGIVRTAVAPSLYEEVEADGVALERFSALTGLHDLVESDYVLARATEPCANCGAENAREVLHYSDPPSSEWLCETCLRKGVKKLSRTDVEAFYGGRPRSELAFGSGHVALLRKGYWEVVDKIVRPLSYYRPGQRVYGSLESRNDEQVFALDALLNPKKSLVTLLGPQGSGKTLLAIAVGMELTERQEMEKVVYTREIVPMGRDLGALPGTEEEKMREWVMPAYDALEALFERPRRGHGARAERETLEERVDYLKRLGQIEFKSIAFFRGRSFTQRFLILDEAQNVTPHQAAITVKRAGKGTKVVLIGDPEQIDSPYLSRGADGLSFIAQKMRGQDLFACVQLESAERSPLAERCRQLGL
jgi:PhoH-like ATPase